ncbi:MAG TPA: hypothetical protein VFL10_12765 [Ornithinibacter sp.]|nr:hypothetical protein [Ornithinibacter sp.]
MPTAPRRRVSREQRAAVGARLAEDHAGLAHRRDLRAAGVSRADVRSEVTAGRWTTAGRHTVVIGTGRPVGEGLWWQALWESGAGAVLDGVSALLAAGLTGFTADTIDVAIPKRNRRHVVTGVTLHLRADVGPTTGSHLVRCRPEWATIRAAQWAGTDRTAALLVCLAVQQRLVASDRLLVAWSSVGRSRRRRFLDAVIRDVCDGAHSLGELDFARMCRHHGLPPPTRQVVRTAPGGRVYLDVAWEEIGLVVEIDGGHHTLALNPITDALRQNEVTLGDDVVLRVPVLGLRLTPDAFMGQVVRAHRLRSGRRAA